MDKTSKTPEMPPKDPKHLKRIKELMKDGLAEAGKNPEKYWEEERQRHNKTKPFKSEKGKKKTASNPADAFEEALADRRQASQEDPKKLPVEVGSKLSVVRQAIYDHGRHHTPAERETIKIVSKVEWNEASEFYTVWIKGSTQSISVGPGPMQKIPQTFKLQRSNNGSVFLTNRNLKYLVTHLDGKEI